MAAVQLPYFALGRLELLVIDAGVAPEESRPWIAPFPEQPHDERRGDRTRDKEHPNWSAHVRHYTAPASTSTPRAVMR